MMFYIRICDGTNNTEAVAIFFCQQCFYIYYVGAAIGVLFGIHTMISSSAYHSAERQHAAQFLVDCFVECQRFRCFGSIAMLHEICKREV